MTEDGNIIEYRVSSLEKKQDKIADRVKENEDDIVRIRIEIKDLKLIRQIVFGLVGLALLSVWDKIVP